jgi:hypothetical protein
VPGRRNAREERYRHAISFPDRSAAFHHLLVSNLPEFDRAVVGWPAIIDHLTSLGALRRDGRRLRIRQVQRWRHSLGLPIVAGCIVIGRHWSPPLSTTYALTAWVLAQRSTSEPTGYRVRSHPQATRRAERASENGVQGQVDVPIGTEVETPLELPTAATR